MKLLDRYIFTEFTRSFLTAMAGILTVYLCVDFLQKADDFIRHQANLSTIISYFLYSLPAMAAPSIPMAALIATLLSLSALSRHNEIVAMRASGVSLGRIIAPVVAGGLMIAAFAFLNNEIITPAYSERANHIRNVEIEKKEQKIVFQQRHLWLRGPDNSIANIDLITPDRTEMLNLHIYKLNPDFSVRERITAGSLLWQDGAWRLRNAWKFTPSGDGMISQPADGEVYNIVDNPQDLGMIAKRSEEMSFNELWEYVRKLKSSGYNATRYEVDLYGKLAFPLSSLLMVLIATPLSLQRVRSGGAGTSIAFAVMIAFSYWGLMSVGAALGRSGTLHPAIAAWIANIVFGSAAVYVLRRMHMSNG
ncbi:MAG: LPS export ABC transporter permease LptG [Nitrospirae bacterium GWC2_57_13]|jgi:lipopolysaccharide export system permease protein|nr:MAG: LPS export ABC transporter permease LptG [Nitrospirae bacterium GWC1_57_7]OGW26588.1 MAG: LPS export ABC transporter permease LptG [Nitrospirae bacterium GWC2_57_13]HAS53178.1 LPS export ABC transporter permease LptG [Nitrospiraceae bacterium]